MAAGHRQVPHRGLWPDRDFAGRVRQPARHALERHHRLAAALDRGVHPQRRLHRAADLDRLGRHREVRWRDLRPWAAGDERLLAESRGNRQGDAGRLAKTGDVGHIDSKGYVTITDRKKDMILVSGFNVYPNEIESVVAMHPGVLECAAVGVPDDKSGEAVKVVIVKKHPNLTKESVIEHCKRELTGYKIPKYVEFRDSLPKTPIGKILRRELRGK